MKAFIRVNDIKGAIAQLQRLGKVVAEKTTDNNGEAVYFVDGKEYPADTLEILANSVVKERMSPR